MTLHGRGFPSPCAVCLDRHKAHVLATHGLAYCLCVQEVVLVRLDEWLHELSRNQPDVMTLLRKAVTESELWTRFQPDKKS